MCVIENRYLFTDGACDKGARSRRSPQADGGESEFGFPESVFLVCFFETVFLSLVFSESETVFLSLVFSESEIFSRV